MKTVFLDRDGVIVHDFGHYITRPDQLFILPNVPEALNRLKAVGFKLIVVTNQAGVGKNLLSQAELDLVNQSMREQLNGVIDAIYCCTHTAADNCDCRKPKPGLIQTAKLTYDFDPAQSFLVGDKRSDIAAGNAMQLHTILVRTGHAGRDDCLGIPNAICTNLPDAANYIMQRSPLLRK